ncbi:MAG TPA: DUF4394 domain-containing protein, partial [Luteibaculaceae bacterium]|nr:DUF4394 domain-containing protein [Luteibaculaceae bacterium]
TSDMDIWFDESTGSDISYFAGNVTNTSADNLYTINLTTGNVTLVGAIGSNLAVRNIAVAIDRTAPAPVGALAYAINTNNFLCSFYTGTPNYIVAAPQITGVSAGYTIEGIDVRPLTGDLYLFAYNRTTDVAKMYTVNTTTGVATQVGNDSIVNLGLGSQVNFDFNPTVDRIRLSSSNDKNFRLNPITGALVATDGNLKYAMTDVNFGINPNIGAIAYTQSYAGASSTVLYVYDDSLNVFGTQIPPNDGVLNTIGSSGITVDLANQSTDFDIFFDPVTLTNQAFFVANPNASALDNLYTVNLGSGSVTLVDGIGNGIAIRHFSLGIDRTAPAIAGQLVYATTSNNNLISFYTGNPNYIRSQVAVGGIPAGYTLVGTDYRPNGGLLYGLAYNGTTQTAKLYTINEATGAATAVGADSISPIDLSGRVAFDFNPTVDRIRVETSNNKNYRLNPFTGALAATDLDLKFANGDVNAGKDPNIGTGAYINSRAGATTTTLYVFDDSLNVIATQIPPNDGVLNTVGNTGFTQDLMDQTSDMDIYYDPSTMSNLTYMNANVSGSNDNLYSINLSSGAATFVSRIGLGIAVRDISVKLDPSSVGVAELGSRKAIQMNVFPNPATDQATLVFSNPQGQSYTLRVMDITGRELLVKNLKGEAGNSNLRLDVNGMPAGIYPIQIELQDGTLFQGKVVK